MGPQSTCHALDRGASTMSIIYPLGLKGKAALFEQQKYRGLLVFLVVLVAKVGYRLIDR